MLFFVLVLAALVASEDAARMMRAGMAKDWVMVVMDVPRPVPGPTELLVRVQATAVNRAGWLLSFIVPPSHLKR